MRNSCAVVVVLLLTLLPGPATAADTSPEWMPSRTVGPYARNVDLATHRNGDTVVVWSAKDAVKARFKPASGRWGPVERVAPKASIGDDSVVFTGRGRATVVWADGAGLHVSDRRRDGSWRPDRAAPLRHEDAGACGDESAWGPVVMAADRVGNLLLSWDELGCEGYASFSHYVWRKADGTWSRLFDGGGGGDHHDVVFPRQGRALMVSATDAITTQTARAGGMLGPRRVVVPHGGYNGMDVDLNGRGDLVVVARSLSDPSTGSLVAVTRPAGAPWSRPHHTAVHASEAPSVDVAGNGRIVVTYLRRGERVAVLGQSGRVEGNTWAPPVALATGIRTSVRPPDVAARGDGTAMVVWNRALGSNTLSTHAVVRSVGGEWSAPVRLSGRRTVDGDAYVIPDVVRSPGGFTVAYVRNGARLVRYRQ